MGQEAIKTLVSSGWGSVVVVGWLCNKMHLGSIPGTAILLVVRPNELCKLIGGQAVHVLSFLHLMTLIMIRSILKRQLQWGVGGNGGSRGWGQGDWVDEGI